MKKNIRFILVLLKMRLAHMMVFRVSFFGGFIVDSTVFLVQLLMFNVIYSQVDSIGGWSRGQMLVFIGTFSLLNAINMTIYFFGINSIPAKIKNGDLDHYLTKPINPLLRLTFENINLGSAPLILFSIGIVVYGLSVQDAAPSVAACLLYIIFIILMTLLYYDMEVLIRTIPFFVISAQSIEQIEGALLDLTMKIPGVVFKGAFKLIFYLALPYGIMATIPTQIITDSISAVEIAYGAAIVVIFTMLALRFWRLGLKHYKSASS